MIKIIKGDMIVANMCSVVFEIEFESQKDQENYIKEFNRKLKVMVEDDSVDGIKLTDEKYLFDSEITHEGDKKISMIGWVKWVFNNDDIIKYVKTCIQSFDIKNLTCQYEELGQLIYGRYRYADNVLTDTYINQDNKIFNREDFGDSDDFFDDLERLLENEGIEDILM